MNDWDIIVEGNYKALAKSMIFRPLDAAPVDPHRLAIVGRLTDAICKRALIRGTL